MLSSSRGIAAATGLVVLAWVVAFGMAGEPPGGGTPQIADVTLVSPPTVVWAQCKATARRVGYRIPCPTLLPEQAQPTRVVGPFAGSRFASDFIHPVFGAFNRWVSLSVEFPSEKIESHLVVVASPRVVSPRHFVYLEPSPVDRATVVGTLRFRDGAAQWVFVPPSSSSIFGGHTVLLWSSDGHTYGVGFHGKGKVIRDLDRAVADGVRLVGP